MTIGLRGWLSLAMAGLALVVALLATAIYSAFAVRATVTASAERARALAQEAAVLSSHAASGLSADDAVRAVGRDPLLAGLFRSSLASDPTLIDMGVFDPAGRAMAHSQPDRRGQTQAFRPALEQLDDGGVLLQSLRMLGPAATYDEVVPLRAGDVAFGEVRVGVSTTLLRAQLFAQLRAGLWVALCALLIAMAVAVVFAQLLTRRVRDAVTGLERLREGEFGHRLAVEGRDELALLASSINALGARLEAARLNAAMGHVDPRELLDATGKMAEWAKVASGLAHEMADPLNAAALHLGHLKRKWTEATPEATRHLTVLESELKRLEQIVVGFRRFAMLGEMKPTWFNPGELLADIVERAEETLREQRTTLAVERDALPDQFWGDTALIRQAVSNLISNAEEAMPGGGDITLHARGAEGTLEIEVADRGPGIPADVLPRIFDLYFTTRADGTGIGLAVVQQVARMHGGTVQIDSRDGKGTRVALRLPVKNVEAVAVAP
jgi:signal transduction histidine kinase